MVIVQGIVFEYSTLKNEIYNDTFNKLNLLSFVDKFKIHFVRGLYFLRRAHKISEGGGGGGSKASWQPHEAFG